MIAKGGENPTVSVGLGRQGPGDDTQTDPWDTIVKRTLACYGPKLGGPCGSSEAIKISRAPSPPYRYGPTQSPHLVLLLETWGPLQGTRQPVHSASLPPMRTKVVARIGLSTQSGARADAKLPRKTPGTDPTSSDPKSIQSVDPNNQ
jgi:hypothetical protein